MNVAATAEQRKKLKTDKAAEKKRTRDDKKTLQELHKQDKEAEAKAKQEAGAKAKQEAEAKAKQEAEAKAKQDKKRGHAGQNTDSDRKPSIQDLSIDGNNPMSRTLAAGRVIAGETSTNPISAADSILRTRTGSASHKAEI
jgi:hypothetical protein